MPSTRVIRPIEPWWCSWKNLLLGFLFKWSFGEAALPTIVSQESAKCGMTCSPKSRKLAIASSMLGPVPKRLRKIR